jgi:hypothetical protein
MATPASAPIPEPEAEALKVRILELEAKLAAADLRIAQLIVALGRSLGVYR